MDENKAIESPADDSMIEQVTDIVSAYLSHNRVPVSELQALIASVHTALIGLSQTATSAEPEHKQLTPAQIRKSIRPDGIVSFIDGKSYKTLKRHLTKHGLTPDTYRTRYGLPSDYPTTAASYSEARSALAKGLGLGQRRKSAELNEAISRPIEEIPEPAQKPGRGRKKAAPAE